MYGDVFTTRECLEVCSGSFCSVCRDVAAAYNSFLKRDNLSFCFSFDLFPGLGLEVGQRLQISFDILTEPLVAAAEEQMRLAKDVRTGCVRNLLRVLDELTVRPATMHKINASNKISIIGFQLMKFVLWVCSWIVA